MPGNSPTPMTAMDSFREDSRAETISLEEVRAQVKAMEEEHRRNGIKLSGRIIHLCHYLPVVATLNNSHSPPQGLSTPPLDAVDLDKRTWTLSPRYGHSAMISGIRSLTATHEEIIIGWTGDIQNAVGVQVPSASISAEDKKELEQMLKIYCPEKGDEKLCYIPVWLDDDVAHGHYDGYSKQGGSPFFFSSMTYCRQTV
jgi:trehalose 6-phosphate synthase/phosphatase